MARVRPRAPFIFRRKAEFATRSREGNHKYHILVSTRTQSGNEGSCFVTIATSRFTLNPIFQKNGTVGMAPMRLSFFCAAGVGLTFVYGLLMGVLHECFGGLLVPVLAGGLKPLSRTPQVRASSQRSEVSTSFPNSWYWRPALAKRCGLFFSTEHAAYSKQTGSTIYKNSIYKVAGTTCTRV